MVNPLHKIKCASKRKKQALRSLIAGFVLFLFFYFITKFISVPLCPIRNIFGISCFGCGLTRGIVAVLKLDFYGAIHYHVLSIPICVCIIIFAFCCLTDIILNRNDVERIENQLKKKYMFIIYFVTIVISTYLNIQL